MEQIVRLQWCLNLGLPSLVTGQQTSSSRIAANLSVVCRISLVFLLSKRKYRSIALKRLIDITAANIGRPRCSDHKSHKGSSLALLTPAKISKPINAFNSVSETASHCLLLSGCWLFQCSQQPVAYWLVSRWSCCWTRLTVMLCVHLAERRV